VAIAELTLPQFPNGSFMPTNFDWRASESGRLLPLDLPESCHFTNRL